MHLAFFDESGDPGFLGSPTEAFVLSAVIVNARDWFATLDQIIGYRRFLLRYFGIPTRAELKSNWIIRGKRDLECLKMHAHAARLSVFESALRFQAKVGTIQTFAVVISKDAILNKSLSPRELCWIRAIERLNRFAESTESYIKLFPDEGHGYFIRRLLRKMRRHHFVGSFFGGGHLGRRAERLIEDPSDRQSHESYFVQLADLNAYAAYRHIHPVPAFPKNMWNNLGSSRIIAVNRLAGGPAGIVRWPRP